VWVPPEDKDPVLRHHPGRKSIGNFGEVRLGDGMFVFSRENLQFNGQTFWDFTKLLRQRSRRKEKSVVIIIDNAKYHHVKMHKPWRDKRHVKGFTLDYLPPYSPDPNPIERVWKLTRRVCLHDQYFPTLQSVSAVVEKQFVQWERGTETLRKLCAM